MNAIRRAAALVVLGVGGAAACTVVAPTPTPTPTLTGAPNPTAVATATPSPSPTPDPATMGLLEFGRTLRIQSLPPDVSAKLFEFASTGDAVILSMGEPGDEAAPDLWRIYADPGEQLERIWRNEDRGRSIVNLGGDFDTIAFVDMSITGDPDWDLWLLPGDGDAILLDSFVGGDDVSSYVPSFSVYEQAIVWAAFDRGADGRPVSQLLTAAGPGWEPRILAERVAAEAEFWFPSLLGSTFVYQEIVYTDGGLSDERHVYLAELGTDAIAPRRLDTSGQATMPGLGQLGIVWKETEPGTHMLTWGVMRQYDPATAAEVPIDTGIADYVDFPSVGERFVAWHAADRTRFGVYDLERAEPRGIARFPATAERQVVAAHLANSLLVWLDVEQVSRREQTAYLRYAYLPGTRQEIVFPP